MEPGAGRPAPRPVEPVFDPLPADLDRPPLRATLEWLLLGYFAVLVFGFVMLRFSMSSGNEFNVDRAIFTATDAGTLTGFQLNVGISQFKPGNLLGPAALLLLTLGGSFFTLAIGSVLAVRILRLRYTDGAGDELAAAARSRSRRSAGRCSCSATGGRRTTRPARGRRVREQRRPHRPRAGVTDASHPPRAPAAVIRRRARAARADGGLRPPVRRPADVGVFAAGALPRRGFLRRRDAAAVARPRVGLAVAGRHDVGGDGAGHVVAAASPRLQRAPNRSTPARSASRWSTPAGCRGRPSGCCSP